MSQRALLDQTYNRTSYKRDDFNFPIVNFQVLCSNILAAPVYEVYISQLI
jgi:hypothetical protein